MCVISICIFVDFLTFLHCKQYQGFLSFKWIESINLIIWLIDLCMLIMTWQEDLWFGSWKLHTCTWNLNGFLPIWKPTVDDNVLFCMYYNDNSGRNCHSVCIVHVWSLLWLLILYYLCHCVTVCPSCALFWLIVYDDCCWQ